jgi:hypothetical protein
MLGDQQSQHVGCVWDIYVALALILWGAMIGMHWPAAGFVDTEIRCLTELESWNAEKEVQPRVQA